VLVYRDLSLVGDAELLREVFNHNGIVVIGILFVPRILISGHSDHLRKSSFEAVEYEFTNDHQESCRNHEVGHAPQSGRKAVDKEIAIGLNQDSDRVQDVIGKELRWNDCDRVTDRCKEEPELDNDLPDLVQVPVIHIQCRKHEGEAVDDEEEDRVSDWEK